MAASSHAPKDIPSIHRYITTHAPDGKAVISKAIPSEVPLKDVLQGSIQFSLMYTNERKPEMSQDQDIQAYTKYLDTAPAITISEGTVCRVCDFAPESLSPMHRTISIDFGVVLEGEMELVLDSGETQHLRRGDTVIQRGTNHAWRNVTPDADVNGRLVPQWARMFFVLQTSQPVTLADGKNLDEDEGGIDRGQE